MEVVTNKPRRLAGAVGRSFGGTSLSFYYDPPQKEMDVIEFEDLARDRRHVLDKMEKLLAEGKLKGEELYQEVKRVIQKYDMANKERDNTSHFILRLAYCRTEELRRWLLQHECQLFKIRFELETDKGKEQFFAEAGLTYQPYSADAATMQKLEQAQRAATNSNSPAPVQNYYKVPFEEALDLVGRRRVYVQQGFAFVPATELVSIVVSKFRAHLSKELSATYRFTQNVGTDKRVAPFLKKFGSQSMTASFKPSSFSGAVTPEQIPTLAERDFPLCMQTMQNHLKSDAHLRYMGRRVYGLFLKGIGLSMEDALKFWRSSFAKKIDGDKFNKQYAYNIRHNYGKEGKRADYTPLSCQKIINEPQGPGEYHGCPFKNWNETEMRSQLAERKINSMDIDELMKLVKNHHYQLACQKYFAITHPGDNAEGIGNHPNQYFERSLLYHEQIRVKQEKPDGSGSATSSQVEPLSNNTAMLNGVTTPKVKQEKVTVDVAMSSADVHTGVSAMDIDA